MKILWYVLRLTVLMTVFFYCALAYPKEPAFNCAKSKDLMAEILQKGYHPFLIGTANESYSIQIYADDKSNFMVLGIDNKLPMSACILITGVELRSFNVVNM